MTQNARFDKGNRTYSPRHIPNRPSTSFHEQSGFKIKEGSFSNQEWFHERQQQKKPKRAQGKRPSKHVTFLDESGSPDLSSLRITEDGDESDDGKRMVVHRGESSKRRSRGKDTTRRPQKEKNLFDVADKSLEKYRNDRNERPRTPPEIRRY